MNYTIDELFEILQPQSLKKKMLLIELYEKGFFHDLKPLKTELQNITFLRLIDVLFEDDPFMLGSSVEVGNYDRYLSTAKALMVNNRFRSKRLIYACLEREFLLYGGSDRSVIWDAMNSVKKVINFSRYVPSEAELLGCFSLKSYELDQE